MDMQNLLNKLNGLLAEETSNPEPEQLSLDLYQNVDMAGEPCIKCKKGHYTETSIYDDWDGVQHCSNCNHQIKRHLTTDELNELKKSVSESDEAGPVKQCVSCGEKAHVDHTTGMCVDCLTKAEEEQGLSESPMGRATADTKMKAKKCAFCGGNIVGRGKTTEKGDTICKDCDDYYAFDGPGGEEPGISESPMGRRAPAEPHTCETCGRSMPNWEPGDSAECDECAEGMSPEDSDPDELDEASATKHAMYGQMRKSSRPANYKPEEHGSDKSSGMRDLGDADDLDYIDSMIAHSSDPESNPAPWGMKSGTSCWGCGQDWKENWSAEDLSPGEGYEEYGLDADDKICPDCAEELTGGELNEGIKDWTGKAALATALTMAPNAMAQSNPGLSSQPGSAASASTDSLSSANSRAAANRAMEAAEKIRYTNPEFNQEYTRIENTYQKIKSAVYDNKMPLSKNSDLAKRQHAESIKILIAADKEFAEKTNALLKQYSLNEQDVEEAAMCEDCGSAPCVCETEQLEEAKVKNYYAVATAAIKKKYDLGPGKVDLTDAQTAEAHKLAKKLKKDDQKLKESEQDGSAELDQLKKMMECWGPMAAPQASGMNVTTNVDSKTGNKTVTVTADGEGAEDLMQILAMAGIAITPAPVAATPVGEQVANEPAPQTLDAQTQLVDMAGGPNAPHAQYNPDRARDNSMAIVDEAVNNLAAKLRAKFQNQ